MDLKAAFDLVDRKALWLLLESTIIPAKILDFLKALYTGSVSCIRVDGDTSDWFKIKSGIQQGCVMMPNLFLPPVNRILERTAHKGMLGIMLGKEVFTYLEYADGIALLAEVLEILLPSLDVMQQEARPFGLEINWTKTKLQYIDNPPMCPTTKVAVNQVEVVQSFVYLKCQFEELWCGQV